MKIVWRPQALDERDNLLVFIAARNLAAAEKLNHAIEACLARCAKNPKMYRPGRVAETREAVIHPNYILVYREVAGSIEVVHLLHARQNYP